VKIFYILKNSSIPVLYGFLEAGGRMLAVIWYQCSQKCRHLPSMKLKGSLIIWKWFTQHKSKNNSVIIPYLGCSRYCPCVMPCSIRLYFISILGYCTTYCYQTYQKQNMCLYPDSFHFLATTLCVYFSVKKLKTHVCVYIYSLRIYF
jgi:hypothetical protein